MCQWGIWFIYNITFSERILFFRENRLSTFRATPTGPGFSASAGAHVGVGLPAKPYAFVSPRQQGLSFPRRRWPMLALASPQSLCPSPRHANTGAFSSARGRPCWRRPPRKAFVLRLATPTGPGFSAPAAAHVGVGLPGKPLSFATPRQHRRFFLGARLPMLASASPESLCPSSRHANTGAFILRLATPTGPGLYPPTGRALHGRGFLAGRLYILFCTE